MKEPIFKATHIVKQFGPTIALNDVDIAIYPGEIRGFIGENGSGKSTMSAIMTGIYEATSGYMEYHGKEWKPASMVDALAGGIGIIVQENGTIGNISVAENIYLGELSNFSGEHFFEDKKVENFSPLFDLSLQEFDALVASYHEQLSGLSDKASKKAALPAMLKGLQSKYEVLAHAYEEEIKAKTEEEDARFAKVAQASFDAYTSSCENIRKKYEENKEGLDANLVERRRNYELSQATKAYEKKRKRDDDESYMHRQWIKTDATYLKNHYLNARNSLKDTVALSFLKKMRKGFLNVFFGLFVNGKKLKKYSGRALRKIGVTHIQPGAPTFVYDMQDRKLIEIAKCLNKDPEIFIVDETTTALSEIGRNLLYKKMNELKDAGKSVLFISHDLDELMEKCDTLTVLRDGNIVANLSKEKNEFDPDAIKKFMIGRELKGDYYRSDYDGSHTDQVVLSMVDGIRGNKLRHVDLQLHKGEILGIGGLSDCGMHDLGKALFGAIKLEGGYVYSGENLKKEINSEVTAMKNRIGYLSKNRDVEALATKASIFDNIAIASINNVAKLNFFMFKSPEKKLVHKQIRDLQIKCNDSQQLVNTLSGGNKQKVSFAKWIANDSEILILDCPTRGVDIGVKQFIYQLLYKMKKEGKSIIMISEELPELIGMSDRIVIMKDGKIEHEFQRSPELSQEEIIKYMI